MSEKGFVAKYPETQYLARDLVTLHDLNQRQLLAGRPTHAHALALVSSMAMERMLRLALGDEAKGKTLSPLLERACGEFGWLAFENAELAIPTIVEWRNAFVHGFALVPGHQLYDGDGLFMASVALYNVANQVCDSLCVDSGGCKSRMLTLDCESLTVPAITLSPYDDLLAIHRHNYSEFAAGRGNTQYLFAEGSLSLAMVEAICRMVRPDIAFDAGFTKAVNIATHGRTPALPHAPLKKVNKKRLFRFRRKMLHSDFEQFDSEPIPTDEYFRSGRFMRVVDDCFHLVSEWHRYVDELSHS